MFASIVVIEVTVSYSYFSVSLFTTKKKHEIMDHINAFFFQKVHVNLCKTVPSEHFLVRKDIDTNCMECV